MVTSTSVTVLVLSGGVQPGPFTGAGSGITLPTLGPIAYSPNPMLSTTTLTLNFYGIPPSPSPSGTPRVSAWVYGNDGNLWQVGGYIAGQNSGTISGQINQFMFSSLLNPRVGTYGLVLRLDYTYPSGMGGVTGPGFAYGPGVITSNLPSWASSSGLGIANTPLFSIQLTG